MLRLRLEGRRGLASQKVRKSVLRKRTAWRGPAGRSGGQAESSVVAGLEWEGEQVEASKFWVGVGAWVKVALMGTGGLGQK